MILRSGPTGAQAAAEPALALCTSRTLRAGALSHRGAEPGRAVSFVPPPDPDIASLIDGQPVDAIAGIAEHGDRPGGELALERRQSAQQHVGLLLRPPPGVAPVEHHRGQPAASAGKQTAEVGVGRKKDPPLVTCP